MELKDARVHYFENHMGLIQYHLTFQSIKHGDQCMKRYLRIARALRLHLIHITSVTGVVTTKELDANCNQWGDNVVLVGFISNCCLLYTSDAADE